MTGLADRVEKSFKEAKRRRDQLLSDLENPPDKDLAREIWATTRHNAIEDALVQIAIEIDEISSRLSE